MTDIFEEVEEAHRQDKVDAAWRKYGWLVWLAGAAVVLAVGINEYLGWQRAQTLTANAAQLESAIEALQNGEYEAAETQFAAIADADSSLSPLAAHYLAQTRLEGLGTVDAARQALEGAANADGDPFEQLALLKTAYLTSDASDLSSLETLLAPLLAGDTAMAALAQELVAAKAFEEGDFERARRDFNFLRFAPNAPPGLAQRAEIALTAIPRADVDADAATDAEPASPDTDETSRLQSAPDTTPAEPTDAGAAENPDDLGEN